MCTVCNMSVLDEHTEQILLSPAEALAAVRAWEVQGALLSLALRHVEATRAFAEDGTVSMNAWLRNNARMNDKTASALLSTGRYLDNAFVTVITKYENASDTLFDMTRLIDEEIAAKRKEFQLDEGVSP